MSISVAHYIPSYRAPVVGVLPQIAREATELARLGVEYVADDDEIGNIVCARNKAMTTAMRNGFDFLAMQDSDVYCPKTAIRPMLETASENGATMVAAICGLRQDPPRPSVEPAKFGEVYQAKRAGTGLVLIDLHRVRDWGMDGGWFIDVFTPDGLKKEPGQDIYFSNLIEKHGGTLWVDGRIPTRHVQMDHKSLEYPGADVTADGNSRKET